MRPCARKSDSRGGVPACRKRERHKRAHDVARARNGPSSPVQHASRAASAYAGAQQPGVCVAGCTWCVRAPVGGEGGAPHKPAGFATAPLHAAPSQLCLSCPCWAVHCVYLPGAQSVVQVCCRRLQGAAARLRGRTGMRACGAAARGRARWGTQARRPPRGSATAAPARRPQATAATGAGVRQAAAATAAAAAAAAVGQATAAAATMTNRCRCRRCAYGSFRDVAVFGATGGLPFPAWLAGVNVVWEPLRVRSVGAALEPLQARERSYVGERLGSGCLGASPDRPRSVLRALPHRGRRRRGAC